ncbi:geranylgeranyl reductase family protein [Planosporangium thailandense]|uniref:Geranylgeranyl reductase family protein n=1 Tax=Planosporangium thailandense TaxID=765197 RepID=A0ABX0Y2E4_9ACTN|nr:geranylgeranyl reductase family protein [Planosporangium thailandense]
MPPVWDVAVVGAGPAGLAAAYAAASAGARTLVLERGEHPRYKTCGGGLVGASLRVVGALDAPEPARLAARDPVRAATFTHRGRRGFTRRDEAPLLGMVRREEFDDALRMAAVAAGAVVRQGIRVRGVDQDGECAYALLADGTRVAARVLVGADGSAGVTGHHVGVRFGQVDLGLELELPVPEPVRARWRGRVLIDWGPLPGSYGWVFPKDDRLTVGVIAARGHGERTKEYLRSFVGRLGLAGIQPAHDSGHLTRCRTDDSPLRRGRVLVAGDAAGLLEPWTREGISYALRSGTAAGTAAAAACGGDDPEPALRGYESEIERTLIPEMRAGRRLLAAFTKRPAAFHLALATPPGWRMFSRFCRGDLTFAPMVDRLPVRVAVAALR